MYCEIHPVYCNIYSLYCAISSSAAAQVVVLAGTVPSGRRVEWEKCPVKTVVGVRSHMTCMCVTIVMCQSHCDCVNLSGMFT